MRIAITGATGFIGRNLVENLKKENHALRLLIHSSVVPAESGGKTTVVSGSLEETESLLDLCLDAEVLIHLVGIIVETRNKTFEKTVVQGTKNVVEACQKAGVKRIIYMSAIGANKYGSTVYLRTKHAAEELVKNSGLEYTIFRPSLVYGERDGFLTLQRKILRWSPVSPIIGSGKYLMQPVQIEDMVASVRESLTNSDSINKTIEIGGSQRLEYRQIIYLIKRQFGLRRLNLYLPIWLMKITAWFLELFLKPAPVTVDQLRMLEEGSVADIEFMKSRFGIAPVGFEDGLKKSFKR